MKRRIATIVCAVAVMLIICPALSAQDSSKDYIEVIGKAEKKVKPDEIKLHIVIDENDIAKNRTLNNLEKNIIRSLESLGIDVQKNLNVVDLSSNLQKFLLKKDDSQMRKEYDLKTTSASQAAQVMIELGKLDGMRVAFEDGTIHERARVAFVRVAGNIFDASISAIKDAKARATELTTAIGQEIGKAIYIYEQDLGYARPTVRLMKNAAIREESVEDAAYVSNLEFEDITVEGRVIVRFELK